MKKRKVLTFITAITFGLTSMFYTSSYVVADDGTAAVTASEESEGIYFLDKGVMVETGKKCGITLFGYNDDKIYDYEESPIKFTIDDESIAKIIKVHGDIVQVNGINVGTTELRAETPDGQKASVKIAVVEVPPTTTTTAVWTTPNASTTTTVSEGNGGIYFTDTEDASIKVETGLSTGIMLQGCNDDKFYEVGESPVKFTIDNESIAKIVSLQGYTVHVRGVSAGETVLHAETPDGQKTSVKIVSSVTLVTTTTAVWSQPTTTTMTTTQPITSTVIYDYAPTIEFDKSPMSVGETREGRFYNPETKKTENGSVYSTSDAISIDYTNGSDTFKITALKAGEASISFNAKGCAFSGYVSLKVIDDKIKGDANGDGTVDMSDVVLIMQALANPNKYGENGTAEVHLTAQGKANADMDGDGLTVGDAQAIQTMLLGIE